MIDVIVHGFLGLVDRKHAHLFTAATKNTSFNYRSRKMETKIEQSPIYLRDDEVNITIMLGSALYLMKTRPELGINLVQPPKYKKLEPLDFHDGNMFLKEIMWEHQLNAFRSLGDSIGSTIESVTGSGKTLLEIAVATSCLRDHSVGVLVPSETAKKNFQKSIDWYCERDKSSVYLEYEKIRRLEPEELPSRFITLFSATMFDNDVNCGYNSLRDIGSLVVDESHHWENPAWRGILYHLPNVVRSFSFSGTVNDNKLSRDFKRMSLPDAYSVSGSGPVSFVVRPSDIPHLINIPDIVDVVFNWADSEMTKSNDWLKVYKTMLLNGRRISLIQKIVDTVSYKGRIATVPVSKKNMAIKIMSGCRSDKVLCWFGSDEVVDKNGSGKMSEQEVIDSVNAGRYNVLIVTSHVDESFDLPAINTVIMLEGKRAKRIKQRGGRSLRKSDRSSLVINILDTNHKVLQAQSRHRSKELSAYYDKLLIQSEGLEKLVEMINK